MEYCKQSIKNLDEFEFKYIPKSSFERVIRTIEDKKKSSSKDGMWGNFYSVSSEFDHSEVAKACYDVEPREKNMTLDDVYNVLKSAKPLLPSEAAPLFGPPKKLRDNSLRKGGGDENHPSNRNQTTQQVLSTQLKQLQCNKSKEKSKASSNTSVHIVEVVNVADSQVPNRSSKIQVTEQITPNDNVNDEKSGIIECSSDNDETLYSEILDLCNEIEILNEDDGSSGSHHGNKMKKIHSSAESVDGKEENKKAKNISKKLICEPFETTDIDDELDFPDNGDEVVWEFEENQENGSSGGGLRTEYYDLKPETPCEYPVMQNEKIKTESYVSKAETPMESNQKSKYRRPQKKSTKPERPERLERPPTRYSNLDESIRRQRQFNPRELKPDPRYEQNRPDSKGSTSSLENLATQVVKKVGEYQERIYKYLTRIYEIICEPHQADDIHDFKIRHRRSVEFTNLFVRNHLYQIGRTAENIRAMVGNPIDIVTKVNSLFQQMMQGVLSYLKNLEGFIYNNSPDKLLVLTEYIVNAFKVCFERKACNITEAGIMDILRVIDEIRYCMKSCDKNGHLLPRYYEEMERKKQQKAMLDGHSEGEIPERDVDMGFSHSMVDEQGNGPISRESRSIESRQGFLKGSRDNSRENHKSLPNCSSQVSYNPSEKFKTLQEEDFDDQPHKKLRTYEENCHIYNHSHNDYTFPTDKIWNNEAEQQLMRSRGGSEIPSQSGHIQKPQEIPQKPKSVVRKNIYGYPVQSPYDMPNNPYGVPKMKARPKVNSNRSNLCSSKSNAYGSTLNSSTSAVPNSRLHPTKSGYGQPERRGLQPTKSMVNGGKLQSSKSTMQKSGFDATKNPVHAATNSKLQSSKSTTHEIKKTSSDVSTALQKEMENGQLSDIEEEDYEYDQHSEKSLECNEKQPKCGSEKQLRFGLDNHSRCSSRSLGKSENNGWSSDNSVKKSSKIEKKSVKINEKLPRDAKKSREHRKSEKSNSNNENDITGKKLLDLLQNHNIIQNDPNELMQMIQILTKEKFDALMGPIKAQLVPKTDDKPKESKKSACRVKADVEPSKKPESAGSQRSTTTRLAPNVQLTVVQNDIEDESDDEVEVEVPKAKTSPKPSSMTKKSKDKKSYQSDSSEDDDGEDCMDFSKYTLDEMRQMSIDARNRRLERIKNNPLYFNDAIEEPWKLFSKVSDQIAEELIEEVIHEMLNGPNEEEKQLLLKFIESEVEC